MNDDMNANDERLEYALKLTMSRFPNVLFDDDGTEYIDIPDIFYRYIDSCDPEVPPFTLDRMLGDDEVCGILEAYDLDPHKFWYAADYIYFLTKANCWEAKASYPVYDQLKALYEHIDDADEVTVRAKGRKHNLVIRGRCTLDILGGCIKKLLESGGDTIRFSDVALNEPPAEKSDSECIWYADILFDMLFQTLGLPSKRAKYEKEAFRWVEGHHVKKSGGMQFTTGSKKYLVARMMCLMGFTQNDSFDDRSLNGIVRKFKDKKFSINLEI